MRPLASLLLSATSASLPLLQADKAHGQARSYQEQATALLERAREKLKEAGGAARHLLEAAEQAIKVGRHGPAGPRYSGPTGTGPSLELSFSLLCNKLRASARVLVYEAYAVARMASRKNVCARVRVSTGTVDVVMMINMHSLSELVHLERRSEEPNEV
jgi:hypothetical protein